MSLSPCRLAVPALAVAVVAAALAATGVAGGAAPAPTRVTMFGDSQLTAIALTDTARTALARGIELDLRAAVCRRLTGTSCPFEGVRPTTVLDEIRDGAPLGPVAVLLVGYNDVEQSWREDVDTVVRALVGRGVDRILWLTLTERRADWTRMNAGLRAVAARWSQLEVLDWSTAADATWFRGDDIHLTGAGADGLGRYINAALVSRGIAAPAVVPKPRPTLRVTVHGGGAVVWGGLRCRVACARTVAPGTTWRLRASAKAGAVFSRWGGACAGRAVVCAVTVRRDTAVAARFTAAP